MRFGLSFLPDGEPRTQSPVGYYRDALHLCRLADQGGLHYVKMTEHYLHAYGGYCPSPLQFLAAVAASTGRIRLMTGGIMANFHHPLQIAAHTAMLDALSGGRLDVGFARAYLPYEFDAFGVDMDGSRDRFTTTVDAVVKLWRESDVSVETPYFTLRGATNLPRCTQDPHPPVWVAAVQSQQSFAWIAAQGYKLLITPGMRTTEKHDRYVSVYRGSYVPSRSANDQPEVALSLPVTVRGSTSQAIEHSDRYLRRYLDVWAGSARAWDHRSSTDYPQYTGFGAALAADDPAAMRRRGAALAGTPEEVAEQIARIAGTIDIDAILLQIDFGAMPGTESTRTVEMFIDKVLPLLS